MSIVTNTVGRSGSSVAHLERRCEDRVVPRTSGRARSASSGRRSGTCDAQRCRRRRSARRSRASRRVAQCRRAAGTTVPRVAPALVRLALELIDLLDHVDRDDQVVVLELVDRVRVVEKDVRVEDVVLLHREAARPQFGRYLDPSTPAPRSRAIPVFGAFSVARVFAFGGERRLRRRRGHAGRGHARAVAFRRADDCRPGLGLAPYRFGCVGRPETRRAYRSRDGVGPFAVHDARVGPDGSAALDAAANLGVGVVAVTSLVALARLEGPGGLLAPPRAARSLDAALLAGFLWAVATALPLTYALLPSYRVRLDPSPSTTRRRARRQRACCSPWPRRTACARMRRFELGDRRSRGRRALAVAHRVRCLRTGRRSRRCGARSSAADRGRGRRDRSARGPRRSRSRRPFRARFAAFWR